MASCMTDNRNLVEKTRFYNIVATNVYVLELVFDNIKR